MMMRRAALPKASISSLGRVLTRGGKRHCDSTLASSPFWSFLRGHEVVNLTAGTSSLLIVFAAAWYSGARGLVYCQEQRPPNPIWPSGILESDVNAFVDSVLADKSINIAVIPDSVERSIYVATVRMTANLIYRGIAKIHGIKLFHHELILKRKTNSTDGLAVDGKHFGIDEKVLLQVADRVMLNRAVNLSLVPDIIERQLYINCLKLIVHLLDTIAESIRIPICGHVLRLHFEPSKKLFASKSSTTSVNTEELLELARRSIDSEGVYGEFQIQLLACVYSLVLGLVDDVLANAEIEMLSDRIEVDIVQGMTAPKQATPTADMSMTNAALAKKSNPYIPFSIGIGVGSAATMAVISLAGRRR